MSTGPSNGTCSRPSTWSSSRWPTRAFAAVRIAVPDGSAGIGSRLPSVALTILCPPELMNRLTRPVANRDRGRKQTEDRGEQYRHPESHTGAEHHREGEVGPVAREWDPHRERARIGVGAPERAADCHEQQPGDGPADEIFHGHPEVGTGFVPHPE